MTIETVSDIDAVLELVSRMSVADLCLLVRAVEQRFGISAAPRPAMQPPVEELEPAAPVEEQTEFAVVLEDAGPNKVPAIKVVREVTNLGLREAKDWAEKTPRTIVSDIPRAKADEIVAKFAAVGARATVQ